MKRYLIMMGASIINLIILFVVILKLPASIPMHLNIEMLIDGYGNKWLLLLFGIIPIAISTIAWLLIKNRRMPSGNQRVQGIVTPAIAVFMMALSWFMIYIAHLYDVPRGTPVEIPFELLVILPIGLLIAFISNFSGTLKQNFWLGIRVPWVFKSKTNWKKTHRLGGVLGVIGGFVICAGAIIGHFTGLLAVSITGLIMGIILVALIPTIYSYTLYRKEMS